MSAGADPLLLGIDVGTTGCKTTLYNLAGRPVATAYEEYPMHFPAPGCVEQDPMDWWRATARNTRRMFAESGIDPARVAAVAVGCTNTIVPVDRHGRPLHNAIMQLDQRTGAEVAWIKEQIGEERVLAICGNRVAPGSFSLPSLLWMQRHRPEVLKETYKLLVPTGFINYHLTGTFTIDPSRMCTTMLGDIRTANWSLEMVALSGLPDSVLPEVHNAWEVVGEVTPAAAEATGLRAGTPVVTGVMDTVAASVGAASAEPGNPFSIIGTTGRISVTVDRPVFDNRFVNSVNDRPGRWLSTAPVNAAGASLRWFRDTFAIDGYDLLNREASAAPAGANGLIYLPYLAAERAPHWDPTARGVFFGLQLRTVRGDLVRSVMEGVSFALKQNLEIWENEMHVRIDRLTLGGGLTKSPVWTRILADILGKPLLPLEVNETETLGAAILGGMGVGLVKDPKAMAEAVVRPKEAVEPNPAMTAFYQPYFDLYKKLYVDLKDRFVELDQVVRS